MPDLKDSLKTRVEQRWYAVTPAVTVVVIASFVHVSLCAAISSFMRHPVGQIVTTKYSTNRNTKRAN